MLFRSVVVTEQVIKIQVNDESKIAKILGLDLENENVINLKDGENVADLQKAFEGKIKLHEENLSAAEVQQAMELKEQFRAALNEQLTIRTGNQGDTHSGVLVNPSSPTKGARKFIRKSSKNVI